MKKMTLTKDAYAQLGSGRELQLLLLDALQVPTKSPAGYHLSVPVKLYAKILQNCTKKASHVAI